MVNWWTKLSGRERLILGAGLPTMLLILGFNFLWHPLVQEVKVLRDEVPKKNLDLAWVRHQIDQAGGLLDSVPDSQSARPLLTVIESRAIESGVKQAIQRVQPGDEQQVKMWFKEVVADHWLRFVVLLNSQGITVQSATLSRAEQGKANITVTFQRR